MTNLLYQYSLSKYEDDMNRQSFKNRIELLIDKKKLFNNMDNIEGLSGAAIMCIDDDFNKVELRKSKFDNPRTVVMRFPSIKAPSSLASETSPNINESGLAKESTLAILSCGAAVMGWIVVIGASAAAPVTGGASLFAVSTGIAATLASSGQCINGLYRTYNEYSGNGEENDRLDSLIWYQSASTALDSISLLGAGVASSSAVKAFKLLQKHSSRTTKQILKNMTRGERRRLTKDIVRLNNPNKSTKALKAMLKTTDFKKGFKKEFTKLRVTNGFKLRLKDGVGAALTFTGSGLGGFSASYIEAIAVTVFE